MSLPCLLLLTKSSLPSQVLFMQNSNARQGDGEEDQSVGCSTCNTWSLYPHCGHIVVVLYLASQHAGNTNVNVNFASVTQIGYFLQAKHVVPLQLDMCTNNVV